MYIYIYGYRCVWSGLTWLDYWLDFLHSMIRAVNKGLSHVDKSGSCSERVCKIRSADAMSLITIQTTSFSSEKPRNERKDWKQVSPQSCNLSPYGLNVSPFTEFTALKKIRGCWQYLRYSCWINSAVDIHVFNAVQWLSNAYKCVLSDFPHISFFFIITVSLTLGHRASEEVKSKLHTSKVRRSNICWKCNAMLKMFLNLLVRISLSPLIWKTWT